MVSRRRVLLGLALCAVAVAAGCGGGSSSSSGSGGSGGSSSTASGSPQKGGTFTILANSNFGVADPAQNYTLQQWALLIDTHDGLVGFKRAGGSAGTELVPDLATEIPEPTDGGKTYTFQLRDGIKYSDGTPLKASDFVTVFTRQFTVPGPANGVLRGHRRRAGVPEELEDVRHDAGRRGGRQREHRDHPPDRARPRVPRQAGAAVRVRRARQHLVEADRQQRAARYRPVHVAVVQPEQVRGARPQPVLQGVVGGGAARRQSRLDRREVRPAGDRRGDRGRERPARTRCSPATRSRPTG